MESMIPSVVNAKELLAANSLLVKYFLYNRINFIGSYMEWNAYAWRCIRRSNHIFIGNYSRFYSRFTILFIVWGSITSITQFETGILVLINVSYTELASERIFQINWRRRRRAQWGKERRTGSSCWRLAEI